MFKSRAAAAVVAGALAILVAAQPPTAPSSGVPPCDALRSAGLGDRLLLPTDAGYEPQIASWWAENARMRPYCLVMPQTSAEVSAALTALTGAEAGDGAGDWHIAVRSGGHGPAGFNNIANGVTIDLSHMNATGYDAATNTARIQPGGRWANVYADLEARFGVTVAGGRDGDVGVGGFLLGGGISFYTGRMGFGCDSVVNFEVVLANGTVVDANATAHADLWRALRGGGANFGIVTRFDMEALPSRDLHYDLRILNASAAGGHADAVIDALVGFADQDESLAENAMVSLFLHDPAVGPDVYAVVINVNTAGRSDDATAADAIKHLPALTNVTVMQSMAEAAAGSQVAGSTYTSGATLTFRNDPRILCRCVEIFRDHLETLKRSIDPALFSATVVLQPLHVYANAASRQRGGNMLGLDSVRHNAIVWNGGVGVNTTAGEGAFAVAQAEVNAMVARITEFAASVQGDMDFLYLNYASPAQDPLGSYGAASVEHIRNVAAAYDPSGVFQRRIPGGFKISRVV